MFSVISTLFRTICYPLNLVFGSVYRALCGWIPSASTALKPEPEDTTPAGNDISDSPASHIEIRIIHQYLPGVSEIIGWGGGSYIGLVDDTTVLKYPHVPGDRQSLEVEAQLLDILGTHPRIIQSKGLAEHGLLLGYAPNGNLMDYITSDHVIPLERRLNWCQQPAEALSYIHSKRVIHCDLNVRNLLLDENLDLILADFQGMLKSSDGETLLDGLSRECTKSFRPRVHGDYADVHTDLFALGSAIYFIMTGHEPFPELDSFDDEEKIESLYEEGVFPSDEQEHICYYITEKCWKQQYQSARDVVRDITQLQRISEKEDVGI